MRGSELFPISEYYKNNIKDAYTIKRGGLWWTAALLIEDPRNNNNFIKIYKWQFDKKSNTWKVRESIKINDKKGLNKIIKVFRKFENSIPGKSDESLIDLFENE